MCEHNESLMLRTSWNLFWFKSSSDGVEYQTGSGLLNNRFKQVFAYQSLLQERKIQFFSVIQKGGVKNSWKKIFRFVTAVMPLQPEGRGFGSTGGMPKRTLRITYCCENTWLHEIHECVINVNLVFTQQTSTITVCHYIGSSLTLDWRSLS